MTEPLARDSAPQSGRDGIARTAHQEELEHQLRLEVARARELRRWIHGELLPMAADCNEVLRARLDLFERVTVTVEGIRGLSRERPIVPRWTQEHSVDLTALEDGATPAGEVEANALASIGQVFGYWNAATPPQRGLHSLLSAGVPAVYGIGSDVVYVRAMGTKDSHVVRTLAHEVVHALEDQHFDFTKFVHGAGLSGDERLARVALVEASARHFADLGVRELARGEGGARNQAPASHVRSSATIPPMLFVTMRLFLYGTASTWFEAVSDGGAASVDRLYADPPTSTEQVLHPRKFLPASDRDRPISIVIAASGGGSAPGWELVGSGTHGELQIGAMLASLQCDGDESVTIASCTDPRTGGVGFRGSAKRASEGWGGDAFLAWRHRSRDLPTVLWVIEWDSRRDAEEFGTTYAPLLSRRIQGRAAKQGDTRFVDGRTGHLSSVQVNGTRVVVVLNAPPAELARLQEVGRAAIASRER